jgi:HAD superfamily hydrolase (TIGR01450 family)
MADAALIERLANVKGAMFDIDGCLVISDGPAGQDGRVLEGAIESLQYVRDSGRNVCVFTNGTAQPPRDVAAHLRSMGIEVSDDEVFTPAVVAATVLKRKFPTEQVMVFGGTGIVDDFIKRDVNIVDLDKAIAGEPHDTKAVMVGWDVDFGRAKLQIAAEALLAGAELYCASDVPFFASQHRLNVGVSGFIASGLEYVSGQKREVLGKPSHYSMEIISEYLGHPAANILVIGDDIMLESKMARQGGAVAGLDTTGTSSAEDAATCAPEIKPELVVSNMFELIDLLKQADSAKV